MSVAYTEGKLDNMINKVKRISINILGISELRWPGKGKCQQEEDTLYYSGNDLPNHLNGIGVILRGNLNRSVTLSQIQT